MTGFRRDGKYANMAGPLSRGSFLCWEGRESLSIHLETCLGILREESQCVLWGLCLRCLKGRGVG